MLERWPWPGDLTDLEGKQTGQRATEWEQGCSLAGALVFCDGFVGQVWFGLGRRTSAPERLVTAAGTRLAGSVPARLLDLAAADFVWVRSPVWSRMLTPARFARSTAEPKMRRPC